MKKLVVFPLLIFLFLTLFSINAFASDVIIYAGSDGTWATYNPSVTGVVRNSTPDTNLDSYTWLQVGNYSTTKYISYIMFNLTSLIGNNISNANLTLFDYAGSFAFQILAYNTSLNWTRANITWNEVPIISKFQSSATTYAIVPDPVHYLGPRNIHFNVTEAVKNAISSGANYVSIALIANGTYQSQFYRYGNTPRLNITYSSPSGCTNPVIGSYCTFDALGIITSVDYSCDNNTLFMCPEGDRCSQLSYQQNTTFVSQDIVDCSACILINLQVGLLNPHNITFSPNCKGLTQAYIDACNCNDWYCSRHIYFGGTTNTTFNITAWKAGCWNPIIQDWDVIIDENGNITTIGDIVNESCPNCTFTPPSNITNQCPTNTTTICYTGSYPNCNSFACPSFAPNSITSAGAWINTTLQTPYGAEIIAFITSLGFAMFIFIKTNEKKIEAFIVPFLGALCGFCLPGVEFFPLWIWLLLTIFTGVLIFWKAKS